MNKLFLAGLLAFVIPDPSSARETDRVTYQPPAAWVLDAPTVDDPTAATEAPLRFSYFDNQARIAPDGTEETYTAYRIKLLKPESLAAGNITVTWQPDDGPIIVHYVHLIRDGRTIDVLASTKFTVLQREEQLEQSVLTGQRTAYLQVPGLQVGDEIAFAATSLHRQAVFDGRAADAMQFPVVGASGVFRFRLLWPQNHKMVWRESNDLPPIRLETNDGVDILEMTLRDPKGVIPTEGAPLRYNVRRLIEFSDFGSWADVSRLLAPLFEHAAEIAPDSPLKAEASAIAARTNDPIERTQAALQLVEDRIRYVYVGLGGGGYTPATADETWKRRFGDCKAKTVLLVALLHELGIEAEPALVNSKGGDGMDQRLPGLRIFDHVIVRAIVSNKVQWLDATRLGDRYLDNLPSPYRWALPLSIKGGDLENIPQQKGLFPTFTQIADIDATTGVDQDARISIQHIIRGDEAFTLRTQLAQFTADDADRALKSYWSQQVDWATPDKVAWSYDERRMAITLTLVGRGNPGWKGDSSQGHSLMLMGAGFNPPDPRRRPADQDQTASWAVEYPRFRCWATTIRLPQAGRSFAWSLYADPMNQRLGGFAYWRASGLHGNLVRTVMSIQSYEPEVSPQEATIVNRAIPNFNNNMSNIAEETAGNVLHSADKVPFNDNVDWINAPQACYPK